MTDHNWGGLNHAENGMGGSRDRAGQAGDVDGANGSANFAGRRGSAHRHRPGPGVGWRGGDFCRLRPLLH